MPRIAKPYLERDWYVSRAGGEYTKLCHRSEGMTKARAVLRQHLKNLEQDRQQTAGRILPRLTVAELFALFLKAVQVEKSSYTLDDYRRWCEEFALMEGRRTSSGVCRSLSAVR